MSQVLPLSTFSHAISGAFSGANVPAVSVGTDTIAPVSGASAESGGRGLARLLLAAGVSALVVVANEITTQWTEGHLLAAWVVLWTVAFAALAALVTPSRRLASGLRAAWNQWAERRRQDAADRLLWALALDDARVMADISVAMIRAANEDVRRMG